MMSKDKIERNKNLSPNQFKAVYQNTAGERQSEKTGNGPVGSFGLQAPAGLLYGYGVSTVWGSAVI